jgi:predicted nucleic acid-binding protein
VKVIVNDANILIDLVELKLLPHFFALEFEFLTTELVLAELFEEQYQSLLPYIDNGTLIVHEMTGDDLTEIYLIQASRPSLSEQDCSAFYQARKNTATLITSDNTLRAFAKAEQLEVHGHLWVFDRMVEANTITGSRACEKLSELCDIINPKLGLPKANVPGE